MGPEWYCIRRYIDPYHPISLHKVKLNESCCTGMKPYFFYNNTSSRIWVDLACDYFSHSVSERNHLNVLYMFVYGSSFKNYFVGLAFRCFNLIHVFGSRGVSKCSTLAVCPDTSRHNACCIKTVLTYISAQFWLVHATMLAHYGDKCIVKNQTFDSIIFYVLNWTDIFGHTSFSNRHHVNSVFVFWRSKYA